MRAEDAAELVFDEAFAEEEENLQALLQRIDEAIAFHYAEADKKTQQAHAIDVLDRTDQEAKRALHEEARRHRELARELEDRRSQPYFRRLDTLSVDADGDKIWETLYVGARDIRLDGEFVVFEVWNERVRQLANNIQAHIGNEDVTVLLRRSLNIENGALQSCRTEYEAEGGAAPQDGVFDPYLLEVLRDNRRRHAPVSVIRSVQKAQMDVVCFPEGKSFIVQGCAGSGKTMILLHRLSYLAYSDPERDWSRSRILSANSALSEYMTSLSQELRIGSVPRSSYEECIASLIESYSGGSRKISRLHSEEHLDAEFLSIVYSVEFAASLREQVDAWWETAVRDLTASGLLDLADKYHVEAEAPAAKFGAETVSAWNNVYLAVRREFSRREQNLAKTEKDLQRAQKEANWGERKTARMGKRVEESTSAVLEWLEDMAGDIQEACGTPGRVGTQSESEAEECIENIQDRMRRKESLPEDVLWTLRDVPGADCLLDYNSAVAESAEQREALQVLTEKAAACERRAENVRAEVPSEQERKVVGDAADIIGRMTSQALQRGPVAEAVAEARRSSAARGDGYKKTTLYRHALYLELLVSSWYYPPLDRAKTQTALYIDEAQDYAPTELQLLRTVNGASCTINAYGDLMQRTNPGRGISAWSELGSLAPTIFELNQNYRNTLQIAEFCNDVTGSSGQPIGIEGPSVALIRDLEDGIAWIAGRHEEEPDLRTAVIVPDSSKEMQQRFSDAVSSGVLRWKSDNDALERAKTSIPILSIEQCKGLEFDVVYAVVDPEDRNASYIAYTRAIQELAVTTSTGEEIFIADEAVPETQTEEENAAALQTPEPAETSQEIPAPAAHIEERAATLTGREYLLREVFSDAFEFHIPNYQRPFAWGREQAKQLLEDLRNAMQDGSAEYFLGSLVVIHEGDNPVTDVIDGQQRLTTLSILAAAIMDLSEGELRDKAAATIAAVKEDGLRPRVHLREQDDPFYAEFIATGDFAKLNKKNPRNLPEAQANLVNVARYFSHELKKMDLAEIRALLDFILDHCSIIIVMTPDNRSAFRIFSVLNHRGLDLQSSDILKARVIGGLPAELQNTYAKGWEAMEVQLGRDAFERFFDQILLSLPDTSYKSTATEYIQDRVLGGPTPVTAQEFMDRVMAPKYEALSTLLAANVSSPKYGDTINSYLGWLNQMPNQDWVPPAIVWLEKNGTRPQRTAGFFRKLERVAAYMALHTGKWPRDKRIARYRAITEQLLDGKEPVELELTMGERIEFMNTLRSGIASLVTPRLQKLLVQRLETALRDREGDSFVAPATFAVERILPETMPADSRWARDWTEQEHKEWVDRLANLVPVAKRIPVAQRHADFDAKKLKYFTAANSAGFSIPETISGLREWVPETAQVRQKEIVDVLVQEWELDGKRTDV